VLLYLATYTGVVMDTISFKGETYIKGSKIAEELGYTADYVGQLCRSRQVEGTLVGRSWYVSEKSIRAHKKNRYRSNQTKSVDAVRQMMGVRTQPKPLLFEDRFSTPVYEADDQPLIPSIKKHFETTPPQVAVAQDEELEGSAVYLKRVTMSEPARVNEVRHSEAPKDYPARPAVRYMTGEAPVSRMDDVRVAHRPIIEQEVYIVETPANGSRIYIKAVSSAIIAAGFLLLVSFISFEQQTFASRVMPLDTEYYFDFSGGLQATVNLWSAK